ncbi:MAG TPA: hypothetical protein VNQ14_06415 [Woeseiaceae bacterium]|nr:hypothetical protein [Woeseiaceae bacterium]
MARKRRSVEVFSMSFLDCICCGLGAVILVFMIINAQTSQDVDAPPQRLMAVANRLEYEILDKRKDLVLARNTMEDLDEQRAEADSEIAQITALIEKLKIELAKHDNETLAKIERIEKLQSDIKSLEEQRKRLLAMEKEKLEEGEKVRTFTGDGDRQYLTGLKVGGERILVLVDASASMLDRRIVNILRRRNLPEAEQLRSEKWRQAVASVDWLSAQFPPESKFQIYTFNTEPQPVLDGSEGVWLEVGDGEQLSEAIRILRRTAPQDGTNMLDAFGVINSLNPPPDNIILLVDGLPTINSAKGERGMVTAQERLRYYYEAEALLPSDVPVNILLYPMEGDHNAAIVYWLLAYRTGGSFMSVSEDWP